MKPEIGYSDIVMGSYIEDLISNIERDMKLLYPRDSYFEQLSVEKFTLETLLKEIAERDISSTEILAHFVHTMDKCIADSHDPHNNYTFEVSRDAAMSILHGLYFGYLERCGEIEET